MFIDFSFAVWPEAAGENKWNTFTFELDHKTLAGFLNVGERKKSRLPWYTHTDQVQVGQVSFGFLLELLRRKSSSRGT